MNETELYYYLIDEYMEIGRGYYFEGSDEIEARDEAEEWAKKMIGIFKGIES